MNRILMVAALLLCTLPAQAFGAGYSVYEWSARGNGLAGTLVARDADASSVVYNPAAITDLEGDHFQMGLTGISPSTNLNAVDPAIDDWETADAIWALPNMYYTHQLNDWAWFGIAMYSRVGLGTEFDDPDSWPGRYNCSYAAIKSVSINPNMAFKVTNDFSVAIGFEALYMDMDFNAFMDATRQNNPNTNTGDILQEIDATGWGYGANLALRYRPYEWLAFGARYNTPIWLQVSGDASFQQKGMISPGMIGLNDTRVTGTEPIPESITVGVMVKPFDKLSIEADAVWTHWGDYQALTFNYSDPLFGAMPKATAKKDWSNTWRFQVGLEYALTEAIDLRCGYVYDQSPINDAHEDFAIPGSDRQILTLGAGWKIDEHWTVDASYGYLWMKDRHYEQRIANGVYEMDRENSVAHMLGLSVGYAF